MCQVHTAIAALIPSWWLDQQPSTKLLERTAAEIQRTQRRNAAARKSHTKRTRQRLRDVGHQTHRASPMCVGEDLAL